MDSGGAVVAQVDGEHYELVGITSYGNECGLPDWPGVYADVNYFLRSDGWLQKALLDGKPFGGEPIIPSTKSSQPVF